MRPGVRWTGCQASSGRRDLVVMSGDKLSPLEIEAAWKGEELFARPEWQYRFTSPEIDELLAVAQRMQVREDDERALALHHRC